MNPPDAMKILKECATVFGWNQPSKEHLAASGQSVVELLVAREDSVNCVVTFCKELDELFGGGVQLGEVTEICASVFSPQDTYVDLHMTQTTAGGVPGVGKTQLCMQLALDVQIPRKLGGVEGSALYLDTEGSLMPLRMEQMAAALQRHISTVVKVRPAWGAGRAP